MINHNAPEGVSGYRPASVYAALTCAYRILWGMAGENSTPIRIGESGASVVRIQCTDGSSRIEKRGPAPEISAEAAVLNWCAGRLPVAHVIQQLEGVLIMTELPGVNLTEVSLEHALSAMIEALSQIHAVPVGTCPFPAHWSLRLRQAEQRIQAGLINERDFDEENLGREAIDILAELKSLPPLPDLVCFTHGDACLPNFLSRNGRLSGIVDLGRAGITHPAQDWALALRSMRFNFGLDGERMLREGLPPHCANDDLLRRFRLLDEFF